MCKNHTHRFDIYSVNVKSKFCGTLRISESENLKFTYFDFDAEIKILITRVVYIMLSLKKGLKTAICQSLILMINLYFYDEIRLRNVNLDDSLPNSKLSNDYSIL